MQLINRNNSVKKKIRILQVITTLGMGGAERQLVDVVTNTNSTEFFHRVCFLHNPDSFAVEIRDSGNEVVNLNVTKKYGWLTASRKLAHQIDEFRPDVMHSWLFDADLSARLTRLSGNKIPLLSSVQLPNYEPVSIEAAQWSPLKIKGMRYLDIMTSKLAKTTFVACSNFVGQSIVKHLHAKEANVKVIYNSVNPASLDKKKTEFVPLRRELGIPENSFVFINLGRHDPQKGQRFLIRAFKEILPECQDSYLLIAGHPGSLTEELKSLAKECGIAERVIFTGSREDIGSLLQMADIFVFPSLFEGLGIALIEAMYKRLPCIATRVPPLTEILTDEKTGLFFDAGNVPQLAEVMTRLYKDELLRKELGENAFKSVNEHFLSQVIISQWENLYRETYLSVKTR